MKENPLSVYEFTENHLSLKRVVVQIIPDFKLQSNSKIVSQISTGRNTWSQSKAGVKVKDTKSNLKKNFLKSRIGKGCSVRGKLALKWKLMNTWSVLMLLEKIRKDLYRCTAGKK